jgi:hypothetical protein
VASAAAGDTSARGIAVSRYRGYIGYIGYIGYRVPRFHAELPRTATGKVLKRMLGQAGPRQAGPLPG